MPLTQPHPTQQSNQMSLPRDMITLREDPPDHSSVDDRNQDTNYCPDQSSAPDSPGQDIPEVSVYQPACPDVNPLTGMAQVRNEPGAQSADQGENQGGRGKSSSFCQDHDHPQPEQGYGVVQKVVPATVKPWHENDAPQPDKGARIDPVSIKIQRNILVYQLNEPCHHNKAHKQTQPRMPSPPSSTSASFKFSCAHQTVCRFKITGHATTNLPRHYARTKDNLKPPT